MYCYSRKRILDFILLWVKNRWRQKSRLAKENYWIMNMNLIENYEIDTIRTEHYCWLIAQNLELTNMRNEFKIMYYSLIVKKLINFDASSVCRPVGRVEDFHSHPPVTRSSFKYEKNKKRNRIVCVLLSLKSAMPTITRFVFRIANGFNLFQFRFYQLMRRNIPFFYPTYGWTFI